MYCAKKLVSIASAVKINVFQLKKKKKKIMFLKGFGFLHNGMFALLLSKLDDEMILWLCTLCPHSSVFGS